MAAAPANLIARLDALAQQHADIESRLVEPDVISDHRMVRALSIKRAALASIVTPYREYQSVLAAHDDAESMAATADTESDAELAALAREELPVLRERAESLLADIQTQLVTSDDRAVASLILEVRAGVGGDEAAIWAGDLVAMYDGYARTRGWTVEALDMSPGDHGGFKHAILSVTGEGAWSALGYEGGTHQVKRVPATETQGRIHTSTATVAVLAEPEEVEVELDAADVKEMITHAQGPGGQNVNKVATAVHLIHEPTGIEVRMQDTKSQVQNREKAWKLLRARLFEKQKAERDAARAEARAAMIGSGNRAEKIRTYRYKDNLIVDHRVDVKGNLSNVMGGDLQPIIDRLIEEDTSRRLAAL